MQPGEDASVIQSESRGYRLVSALGKGGFGTVFRAQLITKSGFTKPVAVKLLNASASQVPDFCARLKDEARLLSMLRHRAIVHVEDLVLLRGQWAVVMEFIEGVDLKDLLALGPLPARSTFELCGEVASALQVAHEARDPLTDEPLRLVHRDVKPGNIRITDKGEVKLLDFGVARAAFSEREAVTKSISFGSWDYMAPERLDGIDEPAADIFALGIVTIECLLGVTVGKLSVDRKRFEISLKQHFDLLRQRFPGNLGDRVATLLRQMSDYDRDSRPTAGAVARHLKQLYLDADGPWLEQWLPETLPRISHVESKLTNGEIHKPVTSGTIHRSESPETTSGYAQGEQQTGMAMSLTEALDALAMQRQASDSDKPEAREPSDPQPAQVQPPLSPDPPSPTPNMEASPEQVSTSRARPLGARVALAFFVFVGLVVLASIPIAAAVWMLGKPEPTHEIAPTLEDVIASQSTTNNEAMGAAPTTPATGASSSSESSKDSPETLSGHPIQVPPRTRPRVPTTEPVEAPKRVPAKTEASGTGSVEVKGEIRSAALLDEARVSWPLDEAPQGTYSLVVEFPTGNTITLEDAVNVRAGAISVVRCDASVQNCR
jgi:serine/threonine protein kinase